VGVAAASQPFPNPEEAALELQVSELAEGKADGGKAALEVSVSFLNLCETEVTLNWLNREAFDNGASNSLALNSVRAIATSQEVEMLTFVGHTFVTVGSGSNSSGGSAGGASWDDGEELEKKAKRKEREKAR
jgi:hypothetical protein